MLRKLSLKRQSKGYLFLTLLFLFALFFVFNVKSYIITVLIYGASLFFLLHFGLVKTLFFTFLFSLPFEKGIRGWLVEVVPERTMPWMSGYSFYFGFSLKLIFVSALFLLFALRVNKKHPLAKNLTFSWLIIAFFLFATIGTLFSESLTLSSLGIMELAIPVFAFLISRHFFTQEKSRRLFSQLLMALLLFFGFIGTSQLLLERPLSIFIEDTRSPIYTSSGFFRASGLTGHPTFFGSLVALLLPVGVGVFLESRQTNSKKELYYYLLVVLLILGFVATFATISTSALLSVGVALLLFLRKASFWKKFPKFYILPVGILFLFLFSFVPAKEFISLETAPGRVELARQAVKMTRDYPIFGIGLNRFTSVMATRDLSQEAGTFLYPVHNTFLLFFSEMGIIAGLTFLIFFFGLLFKTYKSATKNWIDFGIWTGVLTFAINSQFHTLFSQDTTFEIMMVMLAYLSVL